jgi:hypothetical protein
MRTGLQAGPYRTLCVDGKGEAIPWYIIPFDQNGACEAPLTRDHLVDAIRGQSYTDVFLFSHGWNNDWDTACERYESFINGFISLSHNFKLAISRPYRAALVGVFWPSIVLTASWERAPTFASTLPPISDGEGWRRELEELSAAVDLSDRDVLCTLAQRERLDDQESQRLGGTLAKAIETFNSADQDMGGPKSVPSGAELVLRARKMKAADAHPGQSGNFGFASGAPAGPRAAFSAADLDPRNLVRLATVLMIFH